MLTSNEKVQLQDALEVLNGVISGPRLTLADLRVINDYGDVRFADKARGEEIRKELFDRKIPGSERKLFEELAGIFETFAPTPEQEAALNLSRAEHEVSIENVRRLSTGEPVLIPPSEGGDGKKTFEDVKSKPPKKERHEKTPASAIDVDERRRRLEAEGQSSFGDDPARYDIVEKHEPAAAPSTSEAAAYNHAYGVLTPFSNPTDKLLTPDADPAEKVLTPKDVVQEERRLEAARAIAAAETEVDKAETAKRAAEETRDRMRRERGIEVDKKAASAASKQHDEQIDEAAKRVDALRKDGEAVIKASLEATDPITTMIDDGRVPGESPTLGDLEEQGTEKEVFHGTTAEKAAAKRPAIERAKAKAAELESESIAKDEPVEPVTESTGKSRRPAKRTKQLKPKTAKTIKAEKDRARTTKPAAVKATKGARSR